MFQSGFETALGVCAAVLLVVVAVPAVVGLLFIVREGILWLWKK